MPLTAFLCYIWQKKCQILSKCQKIDHPDCKIELASFLPKSADLLSTNRGWCKIATKIKGEKTNYVKYFKVMKEMKRFSVMKNYERRKILCRSRQENTGCYID